MYIYIYIYIYIYVVVMVLDLMHVQNFHYLMVAWVKMSSSVHIDNTRKDILILGTGPVQGFDDTVFISFHYNGSNSFVFVNATKIYQFKTKDSEMKNIPCV